MTNNRKKGIRIAGTLFIILLCALGYWTYRSLNPTREQVQAAKARIEAYSCYEIRRNGKTMLRFDEDTTTLAATFMKLRREMFAMMCSPFFFVLLCLVLLLSRHIDCVFTNDVV